MLLAFVLIVIGLAATIYGVRLVNERHRPIDLAGALLAAAGLAHLFRAAESSIPTP